MVFKKKIFKNVNDIININYQIPETIESNIINIIQILISKHDNIIDAEKMIYENHIIKKKIIEENLFPEIIQNNIESK